MGLLDSFSYTSNQDKIRAGTVNQLAGELEGAKGGKSAVGYRQGIVRRDCWIRLQGPQEQGGAYGIRRG